MLTLTQGPTSPGGGLLSFQTPEDSHPSLPEIPALEEPGVLSGSPGSGFLKANWEAKSRLTLPQPASGS